MLLLILWILYKFLKKY